MAKVSRELDIYELQLNCGFTLKPESVETHVSPQYFHVLCFFSFLYLTSTVLNIVIKSVIKIKYAHKKQGDMHISILQAFCMHFDMSQ